MMMICINCPTGAPEIPEEEYPSHMANVHGGASQLEGLKQEKSKKQDVPKIVPLSKEAPIPPEMQEVLQAIDNPKKEEPKPQPQPEAKIAEIKPLKLRYTWEGVCPQDNTPVRTVITKVDNRWFCSAYCITHETIEQREVTPLDEKKFIVVDKGTEVKNGK